MAPPLTFTSVVIKPVSSKIPILKFWAIALLACAAIANAVDCPCTASTLTGLGEKVSQLWSAAGVPPEEGLLALGDSVPPPPPPPQADRTIVLANKAAKVCFALIMFIF